MFQHRGKYFKVLQETQRSQTGVMTLDVGQDTGEGDVHSGDQIIYVVEGKAFLRLGKEEAVAEAGTVITIPAGTHHYVRNEGDIPLFILTVYAPPVF
ncbi:MAG TPA: cupin domain-containing protein [Candidatus Hypogeohydataceae bacterium YC40]